MSRELDWASGLFEGEGNIIAHRVRGRWYPQMVVNMTDEDSVRRFAEAVGVGHVTGPHRPTGSMLLPPQDHWKSQWRWAAYSFQECLTATCRLWYGLGERRRAKAREVWTHVRGGAE